MKDSIKTGFGFGLTSGIITTLGLIIGLYSSTNSAIAVIGGIITIAVADALSDALGIHISEESKKAGKKEIWEATLSTFVSKLFFALTFIVPVLLLDLHSAIIASIIWGILLLGVFSYFIAKNKKENAFKVIAEHLIIAFGVIIITYYLGLWISATFV
ncbi:MAG: hypothetical protein ABIA76_03450 [Candidatus Diapherotrites archaeon]